MDLRSTQLKDTYGNLVTIGSVAGAPTTGTLQNGQGTDLTILTLGNSTATNFRLNIEDSTTTARLLLSSGDFFIDADVDGGNNRDMVFRVDGGDESMRLESNGDISFQDTSNNEAFYWDASAGSLGIGTTSPTDYIHIHNTANSTALIHFTNGATGSASGDGFKAGVTVDGDAYLRQRESANLVFYTSDTEAMRIDSSGNVGIGTTSPSANLQINDSSDARFIINDEGSGSSIQIRSDGSSSFIGTTSSTDLRLVAHNSEAMRIDSSGNVGIGTSSPGKKLDVAGNIRTTSGDLSASNGDCIVTKPSLSDGQQVELRTNLSSPFRTSVLGIRKHSGITNPCSFVELSTEGGSFYSQWVDNSGNLRISTNADHIGTTSGTVVGTQTSDQRIKNIQGVLPYGLSEILQLEPIKYALKNEPDTSRLGFTAQQVRDIIPESVFDTDENMGEGEPTKLGMEYVQIIPVLVNAIKELKAEIEQLKAQ